jgi:putative salt-induced outer membrane protein YdiY
MLASLFLVLCLALPAFAGEVHFGDGNVLRGKIASYQDDVLKFSTDYAKNVKIPVEEIQTLTTEDIVSVELKKGSVLKGQLVTLPDGGLGILLDPLKETVSLQWEEIQYINKKPSRWKGNFFLGGSIQTGNVELTSISGGAQAKREWEHDRLSMRAIHNYAEQDSKITSRNTFGAFKFDHFFSNGFYTLISTELLKDEFKNLNLRAIIGGGLGYRIWKNEVKSLEFEAGLTYFSEDVRVGEDERFLSARLASNFMYVFFENVTFEDHLLYYPNVEQVSEYRMRNEASLNTILMGNWSLKLTHIFDYNSNPTVNVKKADQTFLFSLQYNFGS